MKKWLGGVLSDGRHGYTKEDRPLLAVVSQAEYEHGIMPEQERLHTALDMLAAQYLATRSHRMKSLSNTSVLELIEWSFKQCKRSRK